MKDTQDQHHFSHWALVELMGHQKIAGWVTEQSIAGVPFLRVDIPDKEGQTRFSRFYAPAAVYCISPVDKQIAIGLVLKMETEPVARYQLEHFARTKTHQYDEPDQCED